jgi:hypothetical protein
VDRATKLDIVRRKIANGTTPADQRRAVRAAPAATDAVLFTGGIGDAIAVESLLTPDERDRIKTFYYAAPAAKTVRALFQSIPGYPNLKTHTVLPTGSVTLYSKRDVEARVGHLPQGVVDLSIRSVFPGPRAYTGSSLLVEPLRTDLTGLVPAGDYVVVVPVSTWFAPRGRNFGSTDWNVCTGALRAAGLVGVVLCGERIPVPDDGTYVDLTGRTDILQSVELVKRADDIDRGPFMMEDIKSKVLESLKTFFKFKSKIEIKDLGRYPSIQDLWEVTDAFAGETETLSKSQTEKIIKKDTKKLIDTPDFKVYVPETKESACYYGKGTKWCTAADNDNMFDHYNNKGKLYVIMAGTGENIKKFQLHFESEQFMNDKDAEITNAQIKYLSGFPKYKEFLEMLIEEHYGDALKAYDKLKAEGKIK